MNVCPSTVKSPLFYAPKLKTVSCKADEQKQTLSWPFVLAWTKNITRAGQAPVSQPDIQRTHSCSQDAQKCFNPY